MLRTSPERPTQKIGEKFFQDLGNLNKMVITIRIWFRLTRFRKDFSWVQNDLQRTFRLENLQRTGVQLSERLASVGIMGTN